MPMSKNPSALDVMTYRQRFSVSFSYPVHFCEQLFNIANPLFVETLSLVNADRRHRFVVVADKGVLAHWHRLSDDVEAYAAHYKSNLEMAAPLLAVRGGEETKNNLNHLQRVVSYLQKHRIDRHAYVVVVGGGAVLDMVGLAASIVHRGIRLVRVPTTVLAQNDAGIGVKNGINAFGTKNFLGSFDPPFAVLNDYRFLETLPKKDRIAGIAEAVKVALIRDPTFFAWLENNVHLLRTYDEKASAYMIRRCAELHLEHIAGSGDPFERGSSRPLDFGHWAAHRIEALTGHTVRHGEAVAIGMALDNRYAVLHGVLDEITEQRVLNLLRGLGLPISHSLLCLKAERTALLQGLDEFQEHLGGELTITLLKRVGQCLDIHEIDKPLMRKAMVQLGDENRMEALCASETVT